MQEKPTKIELLEMLKSMQDNIERLPPYALVSPISHYDFCALIILLHTILSYDIIPQEKFEP